MSDDDSFEADLASAFETEFGVDAALAADAASRAAAFRDDWDGDLGVDDVLSAVDAADEFAEFTHRFDLAVGDLAADVGDCTDSREYRLSGFGDLAADPEQGA